MPPLMIFDIETESNPEAIPLMPEPTAPGNLKDPEKIRAAIEEKRAEAIASAPLDPDYGKILCIGYLNLDSGADIAKFSNNVVPNILTISGDENLILERFWFLAGRCSGRLCGYNILGFDLPYILRRSMALGVEPGIRLNLARYRTDPITDLMAILYNWEPRAKSLKQVARLYNLEVLKPGITGADVANLPIAEVLEYCKSDVWLAVQLFQKMNGIYFDL